MFRDGKLRQGQEIYGGVGFDAGDHQRTAAGSPHAEKGTRSGTAQLYANKAFFLELLYVNKASQRSHPPYCFIVSRPLFLMDIIFPATAISTSSLIRIAVIKIVRKQATAGISDTNCSVDKRF